jgi:hypothetical protein
MRSIHSFVLALTLGFVGIAFASAPSSAMIDDGDKAACCAKAESCCVEGAACCKEGAACCAKKADGAACAMKAEKKGACCAEGAACCAEGASCCAKAKTGKAV